MSLRLAVIAGLIVTAGSCPAQQADLPWVYVLSAPAGMAGPAAARPLAAPVRPGDWLMVEQAQGQVLQIYRGPPRGLEPTWTDGRLNPNRGLPERQAHVPVTRRPGPGEGMVPVPLR